MNATYTVVKSNQDNVISQVIMQREVLATIQEKLPSIEQVESFEDPALVKNRISHERQLTANEAIKESMYQNEETMDRNEEMQERINRTFAALDGTQEMWNVFNDSFADLQSRVHNMLEQRVEN